MALGSALGPSSLTELHISLNANLGDKGMAAIAQGIKFQGLRGGGGAGGGLMRTLGMSACGIGWDGLAALSATLQSRQGLTEIDISLNPIDPSEEMDALTHLSDALRGAKVLSKLVLTGCFSDRAAGSSLMQECCNANLALSILR